MPRAPLSPSAFPYTTLFRSLMASLVDYAATLAGEARGESVEPRERAVSLLRRFEDAGKRVEEKPTASDVESWREQDRKSTRLNSSHRCISYAVFCLKKKRQY